MVQSPSWEANWFAANQEIPRISRNPKVHYRTHKRPPPVSLLGQPNAVHIPTSHLLEIHPNIIHPPTPRSPQWALSLRFPQQLYLIYITGYLPTICSFYAELNNVRNLFYGVLRRSRIKVSTPSIRIARRVGELYNPFLRRSCDSDWAKWCVRWIQGFICLREWFIWPWKCTSFCAE